MASRVPRNRLRLSGDEGGGGGDDEGASGEDNSGEASMASRATRDERRDCELVLPAHPVQVEQVPDEGFEGQADDVAW